MPLMTQRLTSDLWSLTSDFWNANRTSEPGLGANECVPSGKWRKSTAFRHL